MKRKLKRFKNTFSGAPLVIKTKTSGTVKGFLLDNSFENKVKSLNLSIFNFDLNDYICVLNTETNNASFLLIDDIESIDVFE